jgi:uncharacterized delta-60 repeat protein
MAELLESRRLLSGGDLDPTFAGDGRALHAPPVAGSVIDVAVQSDGKVVAALNDFGPASADGAFRVVRLNADGTRDTTFGTGGTATVHVGPHEDRVTALLVLPDDRIVVGGTSFLDDTARDGQVALVRLTAGGQLDTTFGGGDGRVVADAAGTVDGLHLTADGRLVVVGRGTGAITALRFTAGGAPDASFSGDGIYRFTPTDSPRGSALAPDGKLVITGDDGWVTRLTTAGTPDATFGGDGDRQQPGIGGFPQPVPLAGGKTLLVSPIHASDGAFLRFTRLNKDGGRDTSYGPDGRRTVSIPGTFVNIGEVEVDADGNLVLAGYFSTVDFRIARVTPDAVPDESFAPGGVVTTDFSPATDPGLREDYLWGIAIAPDGKIVVAGTSHIHPSTADEVDMAFARYLGTADADGPGPVYIDADRTLHVNGTDGDDVLDVYKYDPGEIRVSVNDEERTFDVADVARIHVRGFGGNDLLGSTDNESPVPTTLDGGDGHDAFHLIDPAGNLRLDGGAGDDSVETNGGATGFVFDGGPGADLIDIFDDDLLDLRQHPNVEKGKIDFGTVIGNDLDNWLRVCGGGTLQGLGGDDTLVGGEFGGLLEGGDGDDLLLGGEEVETLLGGAGNDTVDGGPAADIMRGGSGRDTIDYSARGAPVSVTLGTTANDGQAGEGDNAWNDFERILGGRAGDSLSGTGNADVIYGNGGDDTLRGFGGDDTLYGGSGRDSLDGSTGNDRLEGHGGADTLVGGTGADFFRGHDGDDAFFARDGTRDTLEGGGGTDRAQRDDEDLLQSIELLLA